MTQKHLISNRIDKTVSNAVKELLTRAQFLNTMLDDGPDVFMGFADEEQQQRYVMTRQQQRTFVDRIERSIEKLAPREQDLIMRRYMQVDCEYIRDYEVYGEMQISKETFIKIRQRAFIKLAEMLGVSISCEEVIEKQG